MGSLLADRPAIRADPASTRLALRVVDPRTRRMLKCLIMRDRPDGC